MEKNKTKNGRTFKRKIVKDLFKTTSEEEKHCCRTCKYLAYSICDVPCSTCIDGSLENHICWELA